MVTSHVSITSKEFRARVIIRCALERVREESERQGIEMALGQRGDVVLPPLNSEREEAEYETVVLESKAQYSYTIPSFYAISLKLRHVYGRAEDESGVNFYDMFFHEFPGCLSLELSHPSVVRITNGCIVEVCGTMYIALSCFTCFFFVFMQLDEFQKGMNTQLSYKDLKLLSDHEVFVAYAWHWKQDDGSEDISSSASGSTHSIPSSLSETEVDFNSSCTTHTLTFKCMGTVKDPRYQEALSKAAASLKDGNETPVRLRPEPENPFDPNAIAFDCLINNNWRHIGYVVQDVLLDVHEAMSKKEILSVKFAWVKFLLCWRRSGPGFYAGVEISKQGPWSLTCKRFASIY